MLMPLQQRAHANYDNCTSEWPCQVPRPCPPRCLPLRLRHSLVIQVVKEDATHTTHLAAVGDGEVLIAPLLELGIILGVVAVAYLVGWQW